MQKKIIPVFIFNLFVSFANSQTVEMDTTYRPRTYDLQVEKFKSYPNSSEDIIFLGNSITAYTNWNELLGLPKARNRGISGDTTFGILQRLDEVIEGKPAKIFILVGINDISRNFPDSLILRNYKKIINRIQFGTPETEIYIQTILPVNNTFTRYTRHYNKDQHIYTINKGLKNIAKNQRVTLINLHPHFLDKEGRLDKKYTEEGLHLNAMGYRLWAEILLPYLR